MGGRLGVTSGQDCSEMQRVSGETFQLGIFHSGGEHAFWESKSPMHELEEISEMPLILQARSVTRTDLIIS